MQFTPFLKRVALGEGLGLLIGLIGILWLTVAGSENLRLQLGLLTWFITLGAVIGCCGFIQRIPFINQPIADWARGFVIGGWFGLLLVLLTHRDITKVMVETPLTAHHFSSPAWVVLTAGLWGVVIDVFVTRAIGTVTWPGSGFTRFRGHSRS